MNRPLLRKAGTAAATLLLLATAACSHENDGRAGGESEREREREAVLAAGLKAMPHDALEKYMMIAGADPEEAAKESREGATLDEQYDQARTAPGVVSPGAYSAAFSQLGSLPSVGAA